MQRLTPLPASRPLRVLVDLTHLQLAGTSGGIKPALLEILTWLSSSRDPELHFVYVTNPAVHSEIAARMRPVDRILEQASLQPDTAAVERCDVTYCPFGIATLACPGIPTVTLIVDLLHRDFPATLNAGDRLYREDRFQETLKRSDAFQTISEFTTRSFARHYPLAARSVVRTYLPIHQRLQSGLAHPSLPGRRYFFYPANAWLHKNHETLLKAYSLYREAAPVNSWGLVLCGCEDERMQSVRAAADSLGLAAHVNFAGYVTEAELSELWREAGALVFPSLYEGFGIPLLEAMAHGVPIVASSAAAIPEIVGPAALLVDSRDPVLLGVALIRIAQDQALRDRLAHLGRLRLVNYRPDEEFAKIHRLLSHTAALPARWRWVGYHTADGLTDPVAIFALPRAAGKLTLSSSFRPLPANRAFQFWCGPDLLHEMEIPAFVPATAKFDFRPCTWALSIRVLNADHLSPTDPRKHGVLLASLLVTNERGQVFNLLQNNEVDPLDRSEERENEIQCSGAELADRSEGDRDNGL